VADRHAGQLGNSRNQQIRLTRLSVFSPPHELTPYRNGAIPRRLVDVELRKRRHSRHGVVEVGSSS
jgi:hypothetical protein